jgi:GNAT superfamily N-acetyltransferase
MRDVEVRTFVTSEWSTYRDLRLRALEDSPDAFGTTFREASDRSDDEWTSRLANLSEEADLPLVAKVADELAGLLWATFDSTSRDTVHIYQMWVAPEQRGLGVGRALLERAINWAGVNGAKLVALSVACGDSVARRMYESTGFRPIGDPEPLRIGSELMLQNMVLELSSHAA